MKYIRLNRPLSKKDRRHSGWIYPDSTLRCPKKYIIDNCLEPTPFYDDWKERRDGFRDYITDWKKIKDTSWKCSWNNCGYGFPSDKEKVIDRLTGFKRYICWCHYRNRANSNQKRLLLRRKAMKQHYSKPLE